MRRFLVTLVAVATLTGPMMAVTGVAPAAPAAAQNVAGDSLVNVQIGDVTILENVTIAAAVQAVAQVCNVNLDVNVLAEALEDGPFTGTCTATNEPITITQAAGGGAAPKPKP